MSLSSLLEDMFFQAFCVVFAPTAGHCCQGGCSCAEGEGGEGGEGGGGELEAGLLSGTLVTLKCNNNNNDDVDNLQKKKRNCNTW